ncbi:hypothetical protein [Chondromyces apiculatus]|nr:hypothetical protein [Chondromyces apiculatus]
MRQDRWLLSLMLTGSLVAVTSCGSAPGRSQGAATTPRASGAATAPQTATQAATNAGTAAGASGAERAQQAAAQNPPGSAPAQARKGQALDWSDEDDAKAQARKGQAPAQARKGQALDWSDEDEAAPLVGSGLQGGVVSGRSTAPRDVDATCQVANPTMCIDYLFEKNGARAEAHCRSVQGEMVFVPGEKLAGRRGCYNRDRAGSCAYNLGDKDQVTVFEFNYDAMTVVDPKRCTIEELKGVPAKPPPPRPITVCERPGKNDCIENDTDNPAWAADCGRLGGTLQKALT